METVLSATFHSDVTILISHRLVVQTGVLGWWLEEEAKAGRYRKAHFSAHRLGGWRGKKELSWGLQRVWEEDSITE